MMYGTISGRRSIVHLLIVTFVVAVAMILLSGSAKADSKGTVTDFTFTPVQNNIEILPDQVNEKYYAQGSEFADSTVSLTFSGGSQESYTYKFIDKTEPTGEGWGFYDDENNLLPYTVRLHWCDGEGKIKTVYYSESGDELTYKAVLKNNASDEILMESNNTASVTIKQVDYVMRKTIDGITYKAFNEEYNPTSEHIGEACVYRASMGVTTANIKSSVEINGKTYPVKYIRDSAFIECEDMTGVTIPSGITSIGDWAFGYCSNLKSISMPNSVWDIGMGVCSYCSKLSSIKLPDSLGWIPYEAFYKCSSLTSISIPNSVEEIFSDAFNGCVSLATATIPSSAIMIYSGAFMNTGIMEIKIPNTVEYIGDYAFGFRTNKVTDEVVKVSGFIIDAKPNTTGADYAAYWGFKCVDRDAEAKDAAAKDAAAKAAAKAAAEKAAAAKAAAEKAAAAKAAAAKAAAEKAAAEKAAKINAAKVIKVKAKAKSLKKKAQVTWKKVSGVNGYEVFQGAKKKGKFKKVATIKKAKTTKWTSKKLKKVKKGKKVFFKVRAYSVIDGAKVYGKWSKVLTVKVK